MQDESSSTDLSEHSYPKSFNDDEHWTMKERFENARADLDLFREVYGALGGSLVNVINNAEAIVRKLFLEYRASAEKKSKKKSSKRS